MKNPIRLLLLVFALISHLRVNADHETGITVSSLNDATVSSFSEEQLRNAQRLTIDPADGENNLTSLTSLSAFPNLRGLLH